VRRLMRAVGDKQRRFQHSFSGKIGSQNNRNTIKRSFTAKHNERFWETVDCPSIYPPSPNYGSGVPRLNSVGINFIKRIAREHAEKD
jgi:hypothetical protein